MLREGLSPSSWKENIRPEEREEVGARQVGGTDSQPEPEIHLSAPNFSVPDGFP